VLVSIFEFDGRKPTFLSTDEQNDFSSSRDLLSVRATLHPPYSISVIWSPKIISLEQSTYIVLDTLLL
jgi:hypothetical protein